MSTASQNPYLETLSLHAGFDPSDDKFGSINVPLYQNTAYAFPNSHYAADLFALKSGGHIYTRLNNPTTGVLEARVAAIEGGWLQWPHRADSLR